MLSGFMERAIRQEECFDIMAAPSVGKRTIKMVIKNWDGFFLNPPDATAVKFIVQNED